MAEVVDGGDDWFECVAAATGACPDEIEQWPELARKVCYAARDRLLSNSPGRRVIEEGSFCAGRKHPRFPDGGPPHIDFYLVYQVRLSPAPRAVG